MNATKPSVMFLKPSLCIQAVASGLTVSVKASAPRPLVVVQAPVARPSSLS